VLGPLAGLLACAAVEAADSVEAQRERGAALVAHLRAQAPAGAMTNTGVLRVRDSGGRRRQMPVTIATWPDGDGWKVRYSAAMETNGPVESLTVAFSTSRPGSRRIRRPRATARPCGPSPEPTSGGATSALSFSIGRTSAW
jgi:hypothetical protein